MQGIFIEEIRKLKTWLERLGYAENTIEGYIRTLKCFFKWLQREKLELSAITQETLDLYNEHLHKQPIVRRTILSRLCILKLYDKYCQLTENRKIIEKALKCKEYSIQKEREILTQKEIKNLYEEIEESILGYRSRAILSIYYGCGLRNKEGIALNVNDIKHEREVLYVKPSKNYNDRYIPITPKIKEDIFNYIKYSRVHLLQNVNEKGLLLSIKGERIKKGTVNRVLSKLGEKCRISKPVSCHVLRHSIATHLLESGMKLEQISQFLGHKHLESTKIYTRIYNEEI